MENRTDSSKGALDVKRLYRTLYDILFSLKLIPTLVNVDVEDCRGCFSLGTEASATWRGPHNSERERIQWKRSGRFGEMGVIHETLCVD